jgi:hypothetical protein
MRYPIVIATYLQIHVSRLIPTCQFSELDQGKIVHCIYEYTARKLHVFGFGVWHSGPARADTDRILEIFAEGGDLIAQPFNKAINLFVYEGIVRLRYKNRNVVNVTVEI